MLSVDEQFYKIHSKEIRNHTLLYINMLAVSWCMILISLTAHNGKNEKVDSLHVTAMKFIGKKRLV